MVRSDNTPMIREDDSINMLHSPSRTKSVRIASPPVRPLTSPIEPSSSMFIDRPTPFQHVPMHRGSPPPAMRDSESESSDDEAVPDPFDNPEGSGNDEDEGGELESNAQSSSRLPGEKGSRIGNRDLGGLRRSKSTGGTTFDSRTVDNIPRTETQRKRGTLDVDAFKRLLLTGDPGLEPSPALSESAAHSHNRRVSVGGSGSSSETQPVKQPLFETIPVSQHDNTRQPSRSSFENESENLAAKPRAAEKKKPPPPKTRHGKLIQSNVADVSSLGISTPSDLPDKPLSLSTSNSSPSSSHLGGRVFSDPPKHTCRIPESSPMPSIQDRRAESRSEPFPKPILLPRRPPTPPVRRNSQLRQSKSSSQIARSRSARLPPGTSPAAALQTPPIPPPRRRDLDSSTSSPSTQSQFSITPDSTAPPYEDVEDASESTSLQYSETGSIHSVNRMSRISSSPSAPPRPPPPRRSGGSQTHGSDDCRLSTRSVSRDSSEVSSQPKETKVEEYSSRPSSKANNILADLSKLQKEVDEFRGKYGKKGS
ncbi:hypothetical protein PRK78_003044 [Emydomyces testavorans]|uniref:Uncharacterized protein n=1 Tax=Emydomyces testavorans TaxID=2070801 RepID=A0AAF0DHF3_9EURO|nr:hypothetical protein PRK78_003044 [Emydomyces testavorans]